MRTLPEKKYFKIGEVADLVGVEPHVLRYWETQFPQVRPHKARSGHRLYRRREVETLLVIRELLHVQRFTIAGARQALRQPGGAQSLLPRFFDGAAAGATLAPADTLAPTTLVPHAVDATDEDVASEESLFEAAGVDSAEGDVVEMEAHGLERDELRDAIERQAAESVRAPHGRQREVVEVEVEVAPEGERSVALDVRRVPDARRPVPLRSRVDGHADGARRRLLEEALQSAHAVLAVLDREDSRERARPHA